MKAIAPTLRDDVEVYTPSSGGSRGRRGLLFTAAPSDEPVAASMTNPGRWLRVKAELVGGTLRLRAVDGSSDQKIVLSRGSRCFPIAFAGRAKCVALAGFKGAGKSKRYFDLGSAAKVDRWMRAIASLATNAVDASTCLPRGIPRRSRSVSPERRLRLPPSSSSKSSPPTETLTTTLTTLTTTPGAFDRTRVQLRWLRAYSFAVEEARQRRRERSGFTTLELTIQKKRLDSIATRHRLRVRFKARRILFQLARAYEKRRQSLVAWNAVRSRRFQKHLQKEARREQRRRRQGSAEETTTTKKHGAGGGRVQRRQSNHPPNGKAKAKAKAKARATSFVDAEDIQKSQFRREYRVFLKKERLLPMLARTLNDSRRKRDVANAVRALVALRVAEALLGARGGLAECLASGEERLALQRFLAAGLLCRIPLFLTLVLDFLVALVSIPGVGRSVVAGVVKYVDRSAAWERPLCSAAPIAPSAQAASVHQPRPPPFAALATLLNDHPDHHCCVDLKANVIIFFSAVVRAEKTPALAQWMRARIFHACRSVVILDDKDEKDDDKDDVQNQNQNDDDDNSANGASLLSGISEGSTHYRRRCSGGSVESSAMQRAETRRSTIGLRRGTVQKADVVDDDDDDERRPPQPSVVDDLNNDDDNHTVSSQGTRRGAEGLLRLRQRELTPHSVATTTRAPSSFHHHSGGSSSLLLHPCPALMALLHRYDGESSLLDDDRRFFRLQLERFLDGWDLYELDEVDALAAKPPASGERYGIFVERIRRNALLLGSQRVDSLLRSLGLDLEHAAFLPFEHVSFRDESAYSLSIDVELSQLAVARLDFGFGEVPRVTHRRDAGESFLAYLQPTAADLEAELGKPQHEPKYAKFFKMLDMHIPAAAVALKMKAEGLDPAAVVHLDDDEAPLGGDPAAPPPKEDAPVVEEEEAPEHPAAAAAPVGCGRKPVVKLRRVFFDAVADPRSTWWDDDEKATEKRDDDLGTEALGELESLFFCAAASSSSSSSKKKVVEASSSASSSPPPSSSSSSPSKLPTVREAAEEKKRSIVADALGPRKAFTLGLSWASLRMATEDVVTAVATLDPDGSALLSQTSRLSTLYNLLSSVGDLERIHEAALLLHDDDHRDLDDLSRGMALLLTQARRPRAKVRVLWLYATVSDRAAGVLASIDAYNAAARCVRASKALRRIMCCVLSVTNFVNYGVASRGNKCGVRVAALSQLRSTRTTKAEPYRNMLQFVAKHCGVSPETLTAELKPSLLKRVADGPERSTVLKEIELMFDERDAARRERDELRLEDESEGSRRKDDGAAARAEQVVADVDARLDRLKQQFNAMDDDVDALLTSFGETKVQAFGDGATKWFRELETFAAHFAAEHDEFRQAAERRLKRAHLTQKASARTQLLVESHDRRDGEPTTSSEATTVLYPQRSSVGRCSLGGGIMDSLARKAEVLSDDTDAKALGGGGGGFDDDDDERCADCKLNDRATTPGAFSRSDSHWYCADCWHALSLVDTNWRNDFGDETYPDDDHDNLTAFSAGGDDDNLTAFSASCPVAASEDDHRRWLEETSPPPPGEEEDKCFSSSSLFPKNDDQDDDQDDDDDDDTLGVSTISESTHFTCGDASSVASGGRRGSLVREQSTAPAAFSSLEERKTGAARLVTARLQSMLSSSSSTTAKSDDASETSSSSNSGRSDAKGGRPLKLPDRSTKDDASQSSTTSARSATDKRRVSATLLDLARSTVGKSRRRKSNDMPQSRMSPFRRAAHALHEKEVQRQLNGGANNDDDKVQSPVVADEKLAAHVEGHHAEKNEAIADQSRRKGVVSHADHPSSSRQHGGDELEAAALVEEAAAALKEEEEGGDGDEDSTTSDVVMELRPHDSFASSTDNRHYFSEPYLGVTSQRRFLRQTNSYASSTASTTDTIDGLLGITSEAPSSPRGGGGGAIVQAQFSFHEEADQEDDQEADQEDDQEDDQDDQDDCWALQPRLTEERVRQKVAEDEAADDGLEHHAPLRRHLTAESLKRLSAAAEDPRAAAEGPSSAEGFPETKVTDEGRSRPQQQQPLREEAPPTARLLNTPEEVLEGTVLPLPRESSPRAGVEGSSSPRRLPGSPGLLAAWGEATSSETYDVNASCASTKELDGAFSDDGNDVDDAEDPEAWLHREDAFGDEVEADASIQPPTPEEVDLFDLDAPHTPGRRDRASDFFLRDMDGALGGRRSVRMPPRPPFQVFVPCQWQQQQLASPPVKMARAPSPTMMLEFEDRFPSDDDGAAFFNKTTLPVVVLAPPPAPTETAVAEACPAEELDRPPPPHRGDGVAATTVEEQRESAVDSEVAIDVDASSEEYSLLEQATVKSSASSNGGDGDFDDFDDRGLLEVPSDWPHTSAEPVLHTFETPTDLAMNELQWPPLGANAATSKKRPPESSLGAVTEDDPTLDFATPDAWQSALDQMTEPTTDHQPLPDEEPPGNGTRDDLTKVAKTLDLVRIADDDDIFDDDDDDDDESLLRFSDADLPPPPEPPPQFGTFLAEYMTHEA